MKNIPDKTAQAPLTPILIALISAAFFSFLPAWAASLQQVSNFGNNPSNIKMYLYVPDKVAAKPPILVGLHWCHGTAQAFYSGTQFAAQADKYGFVVIYPNANSSDSCWDVHSTSALKHNGGGDPSGIISMVRHVVQNYKGDSDRVFVTGHSSGGMMTNVMLGSYPEVFKAGASFAGVPFACFSGSNSWNSNCAEGKISKTPEQWGDLVRAAYPGYGGPRPRVQLWHGTNDDVLRIANFDEAIKQWTQVLGVSQTPTSTENNTPQSNWTRTRYATASGAVLVEAIRAQGQPHNLQILADKAVAFMGLDGSPTSLAPDAAGIPGHGGSSKASLGIERAQGQALVRFAVAATPGHLRVDIGDFRGETVQTLSDDMSETGHLSLAWKGQTSGSKPSGPGIYWVSVKRKGVVLRSQAFAWLD